MKPTFSSQAERFRYHQLEFSKLHEFSRSQLRQIATRAYINAGQCGDPEWWKLYNDIGNAVLALDARIGQIWEEDEVGGADRIPFISTQPL